MGRRTLGRRGALALAAGIGGLGVAGCLGDDDPDETPADVDGGIAIEGDFELPTEPGDEDFVDWTGEGTVEIETIEREHQPQFVFDPPFVRVDEGTTVRWINADGVFHTVTSTDSLEGRSASGVFDATIASEGDTFEWVAEETGRQHYYCSPHAGFMYGALAVE